MASKATAGWIGGTEDDFAEVGHAVSRYLSLVADNSEVEPPKDRLAARHLKRAQNLLYAERFDQGLAAVGRVVELEPDFSWAHVVRGATLMALRRYEEARAAVERAIELGLEPKQSLGAAHTIMQRLFFISDWLTRR
jgi:Flp pilus assembly protein TadD